MTEQMGDTSMRKLFKREIKKAATTESLKILNYISLFNYDMSIALYITLYIILRKYGHFKAHRMLYT